MLPSEKFATLFDETKVKQYNSKYNDDCIECDLNCITVAWALQQLVNDDTQPSYKRCDADIIRTWILSNSFSLDDIVITNVQAAFFALDALKKYEPSVDSESIDFVARYENVLSYIGNILENMSVNV